MILKGSDCLVTTGFLNTVDDADIGQVVASPTGLSRFKGFLGTIGVWDTSNIRWKTNRLYGGYYQYVKFKAGTTNANARGQIVYWDDVDDYIVTPDAPADARDIAGVTLNAVTKGNYGWIQVAGLAGCLMRSSVTSTTIGNLVVVVDDDVVCDGIAIATTATGGHLIRALGNAQETLVNSTVNLVRLRYIGLNI
jgi:hypothetical protein